MLTKFDKKRQKIHNDSNEKTSLKKLMEKETDQEFAKNSNNRIQSGRKAVDIPSNDINLTAILEAINQNTDLQWSSTKTTNRFLDKTLLVKIKPRPSKGKIVILKPALTVSCHCSFLQSRKGLKPKGPKRNSRKNSGAIVDKKPNFSNGGNSKKRGLDVLVEAKRHILQRLRNFAKIEDFSTRQVPRTLEKILSLPENYIFANFSPKKDTRCSGFAETKISNSKSEISCFNGLKEVMEANGSVKPVDLSLLEVPFKTESINLTMDCIKTKSTDLTPNRTPNIDPKKLNSRTRIHKIESISAYVVALLNASGLNWEQLWLKFSSSEKILNPSLIDSFNPIFIKTSYDRKLLFDCVDEVLAGVYRSEFNWFQWKLLKFSGISLEKIVVDEVMKRYSEYFTEQLMDYTLEELVEKEMAKPGKCSSDIPLETQEIVAEFVDEILDELTVEIN